MSRVALVTGASRGIGRAVALELGRLGCKVGVGYNSSPDKAEEVAFAIRASGGVACAIPGDVGDEAAVAAIFAHAEKELGPVEILINNAGITRDTLLVRMKESDWDDVMRTNLKSAFLCTKQALRNMMKARWGRIVTISSVIGLVGNAGQANYAAAKAGVMGFSKSIAREVASRNITVNVVAPGFIDTDMTSVLPDTVKSSVLGQIPLGRTGSPEDIAQAVAFLASESASYITGQVIAVDGGMTM